MSRPSLTRALAAARTALALARWLGPWASERARPAARRREVRVEAGTGGAGFRAWLYLPARRAPERSFLLAPGLHYAGPADPRMDRFCAILAASGSAVFAPFLPSYTALRVSPRAFDELDRAFAAMIARPELPAAPPAVFSISFGSLPALRLCASPARATQVSSLILFGGFADFGRTIDFCLSGRVDGRLHGSRDPLNQPVVFMNLLEWMPDLPAGIEQVVATWRAYVEMTWGRPEMKAAGRWQPLARRLGEALDGEDRRLFLIGCGILPGAAELCRAALERAGEEASFLDPRPHLGGLRCPVHLIHGRDDDVIPSSESEALAAELAGQVPTALYLTGLYGHTSHGGAARLLRAAPELAREFLTMGRILTMLSSTAEAPWPTPATSISPPL